ncbi:nitroreductase [Sphingomonas sp. PP-CC-3A-396]|uniref:nitroreductase n=1 Tax=Sphingomonas sp. PP-CC-3A-396 TaxID=2135655 RepID=UPI001047BCC3|nr:nitroreductase [Sphingomonas sp. PP-CC-3A-396]TCQ03180.1 nitroreductase [Sphingomonas sp. PP-CC-3A-396]
MTNTLSVSDNGTLPGGTLSFQETARTRRSYRGFLDKVVPDDVLDAVLQDAQCAPSNCNTQPWDVHIVRGAKLAELSRILHEKNDAADFSPDFSFDMGAFYGCYGERKNAQGKAYYEAMNVMREDKEGRRCAAALNLSFFGAPQVALLFMPSFGDNVRTAGDIGMYGQTFLLSLAARGLGGIPQTSLGFYAGTIREVLGIPAEMKMLFGISFGYPDETAPGNRMRMDRVPVADSVHFHD